MSKLTKKIAKKKKATAKDFVTNINYIKFVAGLREGRPQLNEDAIAQAAMKDGFFGVITNVSADRMSASEVLTAYRLSGW